MASGHRSRSRTLRGPRKQRSRKPLYYGLGVLAAVLVIAGLLLVRDAKTAKTALDDATDEARALQTQITDGDTTAATKTLKALQASTRSARSHTDGPLWSALSLLPKVGNSVDAAQTISSSLDDIATRGLPPIVKASASLDADLFKPQNGRFDLATMQRLAPSVTTASDVITASRNDIESIGGDDLVGPLRAPLADLKDKITDAQFAAASTAKALRLVPSMLGVDGKRSYLVMFQNNAEVRATGGLPGAYAILTANKGKLTIGKQGSGSDFPQYDKPIVPLTKDEKLNFAALMGKDFRDTNFTPDFPRTAELATAMVRETLDKKVGGVLSIDPVALSYLLRGTGPIEAADGTQLTSENAVDILLNGVYSRFPDPKAQDAFFADSAKRIFDAVTSGQGDSRKVLDNLVKSGREHRLLLWSSHESEQKELRTETLSGRLVGTSTHPQFGIYMNDITASKMQYYLDTRTTLRSGRCTDSGAQILRSSTTLTSTAPADASELPRYITGNGTFSPRGTMILDIKLYAPVGSTYISFTVDGKPQALNASSLNGRPVQSAVVRVKPGQTVRLEGAMQTADGQRAEAVFSTTPGVQATKNGYRVASACS